MSFLEARDQLSSEPNAVSPEYLPVLDGISAIKLLQEGSDVSAILRGYEVDNGTFRRLIWPYANLALYDHYREENFGEGDAGKIALSYIKTVERCQSREEQCDSRPEVVLNFEVIDPAPEHIALCHGHLVPAMETITEDLAMTNRIPTFGINGHGRD